MGVEQIALSIERVTSVLRRWCRDRSEVAVSLVDGSTMRGRASAMFADHVDVVTEDGRTTAVPVGSVVAVERPHLA